MAITSSIPISAPIIFGSGQLDEPEVLSLAANGTVNCSDFLVPNVTGHVGTWTTWVDSAGTANGTPAALADSGSGTIYFNANSGQPLATTGLFGSTTTGTALQSGWDAQLVKGVLLHNNQPIEMNIGTANLSTTANTVAQIGTECTIKLDSTTGFFYGDFINADSLTTYFTVVAFVSGPNKGIPLSGQNALCRGIVELTTTPAI